MVRPRRPLTTSGAIVKTKAAILRARNTAWSVEEIELDPPKAGEVLVKIVASGMCHSDEHLVTGDLAGATPEPPLIGGHEGAGIVMEVGAGVFSLVAGDHVVFGFIPACGRCPSCADGHSNLCDMGSLTATGMQISDGTARHHAADGSDLALGIGSLGTFAHHTVVHEASCIKIEKEIPLDKACLLGCGVVTGWGSAVYAAQVQPGDTVAVVGCGGIGSNAIQGAKLAGARVVAAIDPVEFKREKAMEFGATHTHASIDDALAALPDTTWNRGFDKVIMTCGVGNGDVLGQAFWLGGKRSKIVVTNIHSTTEASIAIPAVFLTVFEKQLIGSLFGSANPRKDIPKLLELYTQGLLDLDGLVTKTYPIEGINEGYADMNSGKNIRGVLVYEH
ncbi:MAG TPA: NDMA-dependent alcohol dehydrogenase [Ilumatobacteraceae bacterium]|nr:NDMA-dependent alcohol dehydrogenase [Ilumatobacteraceae bacterium]HRC49236.1 NDMA-dependent alcohol dehydrogenase [Ilumatobacteraceae bacterium]